MSKKEIQQILLELGFTTKDELDESGGYTIYYKKDILEVYLGNWYIETIYSPIALPYKDPSILKQQVVNFVKSGKYWEENG